MTEVERVAKLEAHRETDNIAIRDLTDKVDATLVAVQDIQQKLSKQSGFIAGVMCVVLPLWSVLTAAALTFWDKWTGSAP